MGSVIDRPFFTPGQTHQSLLDDTTYLYLLVSRDTKIAVFLVTLPADNVLSYTGLDDFVHLRLVSFPFASSWIGNNWGHVLDKSPFVLGYLSCFVAKIFVI